jgi:hypothetical protein
VPSCDAQRNVVAHLSTHCIRPQTVSARNKPTAASRALRSVEAASAQAARADLGELVLIHHDGQDDLAVRASPSA